MTVNCLLELQKAMYALLSEDDTLTAMVSGIYNHVPQDSAFPYVVIGEAESSDSSTKTTTAEEIITTVLVFSRARGSKEALDIMARVKELLHLAAPALEGCSLIFLRYQSVAITQTEETLTWQGNIVFKALIEEDAA